jgi:2,4-didehydro-3-deoxy-L-rhamnonate hydrolase
MSRLARRTVGRDWEFPAAQGSFEGGGIMKLARYGREGKEKPALIDSAGKLRDLSEVVADIDADALAPRALARLAKLKPESLPAVRGSPRIGPCVQRVGNFIAVGLNYADHAAESGMPVPKEPVLFTKAPSCVAGPNDDVAIPKGSTKTDWEVELAIVIGSRASYVSEQQALAHIAGYCICNDVSEREYQHERAGQWVKGKSCPTFGPLGPWLVTPDEIKDVQALNMWLDVNGERMQTGSTATMVFGVKTLVSYISHFMILEPGDVITTGTPPGVGAGKKPPRFLKAGDTMSLGVDGLGQQAQRVVAWKAG